MDKIKQEGVLLYELSGDYKDFRRDTLIIAFATFVIIAVVGFIILGEWFFATIFGICAMVSVLLDTLFFKQLFTFSFNDQERKIKISYRRCMIKHEVEINYNDLNYKLSNEHMGKGEGLAKELKIYASGKLLLKVNKKKYGWTNGLVQEAIKMIKFRNIKRII